MFKRSFERSNHLATTMILQLNVVKIFDDKDALKVTGDLELCC